VVLICIQNPFSSTCGNESEVLDVRPEEIAQAYKRPDGLDVCGRSGILDRFQFIFSRFYSLWSKGKSQVGHLFVSEYAFFQVNLEVVFVQSCQDLIQDL